jgi:mannosyltransferase OCH1-like enzyme
MIPKNIYLCYKDLEVLKKYSKRWSELNPEYNIFIYDNKMCYDFLYDNYGLLFCDIFEYIKDGPIKADFWRVCILYKNGGFYVDADIQPFISFKEFLLDDIDFFSCISAYNNEINPHVLGSKPNDFILKRIIEFYISFFNNKIQYSYWNWSITKFVNKIFYNKQIFINENGDDSIFKDLNIENDGVYTINNKKYQFLKEVGDTNKPCDYSYYCKYNNKIILKNRYDNYCNSTHLFK